MLTQNLKESIAYIEHPKNVDVIELKYNFIMSFKKVNIGNRFMMTYGNWG